jgi:hypothetical protein
MAFLLKSNLIKQKFPSNRETESETLRLSVSVLTNKQQKCTIFTLLFLKKDNFEVEVAEIVMGFDPELHLLTPIRNKSFSLNKTLVPVRYKNFLNNFSERSEIL